MVGPICVYHSYFGDSRVAILRLEVILAERYVVGVHCKAVLVYKRLKSLSVELCKAVEGFYLGGDVVLDVQGLRLIKRRLSRLNRIYDVLFNLCDVAVAEVAVKCVHLCGAYERPFALRYYLYALCGGVCTLVKLSGQILYRKHVCSLKLRLVTYNVELRL